MNINKESLLFVDDKAIVDDGITVSVELKGTLIS